MVIGLIISWLFLSAFDAVATYWAITNHYAYEGNPAMAWCIAHGWWVFFLVKGVLSCVAMGIVYRGSTHKPLLIKISLIVAVVIYGMLAEYHVLTYILHMKGII